MVSDIRSYFSIQICLVSLICSKCLGGRFVVVLNFFCFPVHPTYLPTTAFAQTKPVSFFAQMHRVYSPRVRSLRVTAAAPAGGGIYGRRFAPSTDGASRHSQHGVSTGEEDCRERVGYILFRLLLGHMFCDRGWGHILLLPAPGYEQGCIKTKNLKT